MMARRTWRSTLSMLSAISTLIGGYIPSPLFHYLSSIIYLGTQSNAFQSQWVGNLKGGNDDYKNKVVPEYYNLVGQYYSEREGPYLLGDKVTYVDFAVFQSIDNDRRTGTLPVRAILLNCFRGRRFTNILSRSRSQSRLSSLRRRSRPGRRLLSISRSINSYVASICGGSVRRGGGN
jgi:hypothetical protein